MTVINYYKFLDLVYTFFCEQFEGLGIVAHVFYRKTAGASWFNCTHYLVFMFFFLHTHLGWMLLKFHLRSRLKMSDCYIRNFKFEPLLTLYARIHILPLVDIMVQYLSKKIQVKSQGGFSGHEKRALI